MKCSGCGTPFVSWKVKDADSVYCDKCEKKQAAVFPAWIKGKCAKCKCRFGLENPTYEVTWDIGGRDITHFICMICHDRLMEEKNFIEAKKAVKLRIKRKAQKAREVRSIKDEADESNRLHKREALEGYSGL